MTWYDQLMNPKVPTVTFYLTANLARNLHSLEEQLQHLSPNPPRGHSGTLASLWLLDNLYVHARVYSGTTDHIQIRLARVHCRAEGD